MRFTFFILFIVHFLPVSAQEQPALDVKKISGRVEVFPFDRKVEGQLELKFSISEKTDSVYLDAVDMKAELQAGKSVELKTGSDKIWFIKKFIPGKTYTVKFSYQAQPKQTLYFKGWNNPGSNQIWTQGQGKETSHWLPSLNDVTDKIEFDLQYNVPEDYQVIANGKLVKKTKIKDRAIWGFDMKHPMSSYLVALAVGDYAKEEKMAGDVPLQLYLEKDDARYFEPTYRHSKEMFEFLQTEIGVEFPWQNYKQVPVRDFLYAGMENTTATIFSDRFVIDSTAFIDRNYVNVNAHELAHQWFGDYVTATSSKHHWLQEGFATFYALLAQKEIFGEDYFYFKLLQSAEQLKDLSDNGKGKAVLDAKAGSLTFYQKGAWALFALYEKVGRKAFRKGVQNYLKKYAFQNVTTANFLAEIEKTSKTVLSDFKHRWLEQTAFPSIAALSLLKDKEFVKNYLTAKAFRNIPITEKRERLSQFLDFPVNDFIGQEVVAQLASAETENVVDLYRKAFKTNNLLVRQAIAENLKTIPKTLQSEFESLLDDGSYFTQEKALMALWQNSPKKRTKYLAKMEGVQGFSNKNVRLLWLTLSLVTKEFKIEKSQQFYRELSGYTKPQYPYELRKNAFGYLYQINSFTSENYKNLLSATDHSVWRFAKFSRKLLKKLMEDPERRKEIMLLKPDLSDKYQRKIEKVLEKV